MCHSHTIIIYYNVDNLNPSPIFGNSQFCYHIQLSNSYKCICNIGTTSVAGLCEGKMDVVMGYIVFINVYIECQDPSMYGFDCLGTCNCLNDGTCDRVSGCQCTSEWTAYNCGTGK